MFVGSGLRESVGYVFFFVIVIDKDKRFCRRAYYMVVTESFGLAFAASVLAYMLP
jgi:hypothetical protein